MSVASDWNHARRVLCVRLDNMGDVLMTTPAIRALKTSVSGRTISLLASRSGAALGPYLTEVDNIITYAAAWVKNNNTHRAYDHAILKDLERRHFDAAVIFTVYSQSALPAALMCHLAGIPLVLGHCRENPYRLLSHWVKDGEPTQVVRHEVQRQLDLVATIGARCDDHRLSFSTTPADRSSMRQVLFTTQVDPDKGWIVAHCGATAASRRYSPDRYAKVFSLLAASGRSILLTGSTEEKALVEYIASRCGNTGHIVDLSGRLSLGELACLIEDADLLISNNTGPVHIAAAVQTPVVDLYALTNPQHTPWQVPHRLLYHDVPCKYCYRSICSEGHNGCLEGVEPEEVVQAALELLAGHSGVTRKSAAVA
ncbi:glycosyltransferase family 9 protein [Candidimonas sp. SYP-B2681]|uniref:glycosyltransferase family 9 protein n=1 Tax=Candidimonas sp. SYP-B2681 TaxID=2497686 RepID=UPI000F874699|nr:glycosyltransferase family 9 protein [Candidimonas sp. SYP-B2681]RTZ48142.1 glycosyltransferase family 9 protein [Candidimonas sp. SYP-B2681]